MTVTDRQRQAEGRKLRRLCDLADRIAGDAWQIESDPQGMRIFVQRFDGSGAVICGFSRHANNDEITLVSEALDTVTFLLPLIARASSRIRSQDAVIAQLRAELAALQAAPDEARDHKPKDYSAQASMLLTSPKFQRFLSEKQHGEVIDSKEAADLALKALLAIESKKQINTEDGARQRWLDLRAEFSAWEMGVLA